MPVNQSEGIAISNSRVMSGTWNTCEMQIARKYKSNDKSLEIITKVADDESAKEEIMKAIEVNRKWPYQLVDGAPNHKYTKDVVPGQKYSTHRDSQPKN